MQLGFSLVLGLATGIVSGMMGLGGGTLLVPGLVLLAGTEQHLAQGVSLTVVALSSLVGAITHHRQGTVALSTVLWVAPVAVACGVLGAQIASQLDASTLSKIFGGVLLAMSIVMLVGKGSEESGS